jgi:hypothetical protein
MGETSATGMLVGTLEHFAERSPALTATVSRDELEAALRVEPPAELVLEVVRPRGGASDAEKHIVYVAWKRADLESLLSAPDSDTITFSFDPAELKRAIDVPDVEGHGIRETAVVLSIAAAAAVGVSNAAAEPGGAVYSPAAVEISAHDEATLAARGVESGTLAVSAHDEATLAARGVEATATTQAAAHDEATLASRGIEASTLAATHDEATLATRGIGSGAVAATHDEATSAARGIEPGTVPATHDEATSAARGIEPGTVAAVAATHDEATSAARGIEPGTVPATHDEATSAARGIEPGTVAEVAATHDEATLAARGIESTSPADTATAASDSRFDLPSVDSTMAASIAAALGAFGLAILGASFVSRRREPGAA